ncbi:MAG: sodium:solute symporter [Saprospiraceae bacterium]
MNTLDWIVLCVTILSIVLYGIWKTRGKADVESYLLGDRQQKWWTIGLSIMATQASAITFLSTPGQAFDDGMRFVQFYFGLPIAMVILAIFVLPRFYKLKVYTAYEYLETRFDVRARTLTAVFFLLSRGLAAGLTIFAPAIILNKILGWDLSYTILIIGIVVTFYTVMGGTDAVSQTQKQQMIIILGGMFVAFLVLINQLPEAVSFGDAVNVAGKMGKLEVVDLEFDLSNRYNIWSALFGGTFLFLSYFGTDQSQVQRYLSGKTLTESRLGLLFNGIFKVPMQFMVLFIGAMLFVFYQFNQPPAFFDAAAKTNLIESGYSQQVETLESRQGKIFEDKKTAVFNLVEVMKRGDEAAITTAQNEVNTLQQAYKKNNEDVQTLIKEVDDSSREADFVFITFVMNNLPAGLVGLLLAVIFSAAMSSTAAELNALSTTTTMDLYKRSFRPNEQSEHYFNASKWFTILWGGIALIFAASVSLFDNLIEAVNIIGSLFYGTILGVFIVAFFFKKIGGRAVFYAGIIGEIMIISTFTLNSYGIIKLEYLWLNLIGCVLVVFFAWIIQSIIGTEKKEFA